MPLTANLQADDYYVVLGVDKDASDADIAKTYKKLALKHHPDKNPDRQEQAEEEFKKLTEAYDVLRNPEKRKIYDQFGKAGLNGGNPQSGESDFFPGGSGGRQQTTMSREQADEIFRTIFGGSDPFGNLFGAGQGGRSSFVFHTGGPSGSQDFNSFGNPFESMNFGGMNFGGGFPRSGRRTGTSASKTAQSRARARSRSRPQRGSDSCVVPCGMPVVVHSLSKSIDHNGKFGHVSSWDASKCRYEVTLRLGDQSVCVGDDRLWLRPQNITQLCTVEIAGLVNKPGLNGSSGEIQHYDVSKHRYTVFVEDATVVLSLQPANCILSAGTCVVVNGLSNSECNDQRARIMSIDKEAGRYTVECESEKQISIKYENVLC